MGANFERLILGKNDAFPFEVGVFEVDDKADLLAGDAKVVGDLATVDVGDPFYGLRIDDDVVVSNEVRDEFTNVLFLVVNFEDFLLLVGDASKFEFNDESILVELFFESMAERVVNFKGAPNDLVDLLA